MNYSSITESLQVSKLCFGCEPLGGTDWGNVNIFDIEVAINQSIELGVNFFDTADVYGLGLSEERLSRILGYRRANVVIATKGGVSWAESGNSKRASISMNSSPSYLRKAIEESLRRLRLDCLPIYYVHWPDPNIDIRVTFELLATLQREGKIGLLGCSNYNATQIALAAEVASVSLVQLPLSLITGVLNKDILNVCSKNNIRIVAYNVLANGLLTGKYDETSVFLENDRRSKSPLFQGNDLLHALEIVDIAKIKAEKKGLTVGQYAINWVLKQHGVISAITGIKNVRQIQQNVGGV